MMGHPVLWAKLEYLDILWKEQYTLCTVHFTVQCPTSKVKSVQLCWHIHYTVCV